MKIYLFLFLAFGLLIFGCISPNDVDSGQSITYYDLKFTVSDMEIRTCDPGPGGQVTTYLVFHLQAENTAKIEMYASTYSFFSVKDPLGYEYDCGLLPFPVVSEGACLTAEENAYVDGKLSPGSKKEGDVWVEIGTGTEYTPGTWQVIYAAPTFDEDVLHTWSQKIE